MSIKQQLHHFFSQRELVGENYGCELQQLSTENFNEYINLFSKLIETFVNNNNNNIYDCFNKYCKYNKQFYANIDNCDLNALETMMLDALEYGYVGYAIQHPKANSWTQESLENAWSRAYGLPNKLCFYTFRCTSNLGENTYIYNSVWLSQFTLQLLNAALKSLYNKPIIFDNTVLSWFPGKQYIVATESSASLEERVAKLEQLVQSLIISSASVSTAISTSSATLVPTVSTSSMTSASSSSFITVPSSSSST